MIYRDLLPGRQGGKVIASHITIPDGGPVPDYVHHHDIRYQSIHCVRGWVRVVYEDQGPPFRLQAGDCVLQPPGIRHRVLDSSPGLEVVEIGCPAAHPTYVDHDLRLPTADVRPDREFGGQRFVRHRASAAVWQPWRADGFECADTGIGAATGGVAGACNVRGTSASSELSAARRRAAVLVRRRRRGHARSSTATRTRRSKLAWPSPSRLGSPHRLVDADGLELLEVTLPG